MLDANFDFDFAPRTYWPGEWATELTQTRGSWEKWFKQGLAHEGRPLLGGTPASLNAGEYLPGFLPSEVEIARIELASALGDVTSIRARPAENGGIDIRVVDDDDWRYVWAPTWSQGPLTMRELISLIDAAYAEESEEDGTGFTTRHWDHVVENGSLQDAIEFVRISSFYYPRLEQYYQHQATLWMQSRTRDSYDENADFYDDEHDIDQRAAPELASLESLGRREGERILEVGVGTAWTFRRLLAPLV